MYAVIMIVEARLCSIRMMCNEDPYGVQEGYHRFGFLSPALFP